MKLRKTVSLLVASSMLATMWLPSSNAAAYNDLTTLDTRFVVDDVVASTGHGVDVQNVDVSPTKPCRLVFSVDPTTSGAALADGKERVDWRPFVDRATILLAALAPAPNNNVGVANMVDAVEWLMGVRSAAARAANPTEIVTTAIKVYNGLETQGAALGGAPAVALDGNASTRVVEAPADPTTADADNALTGYAWCATVGGNHAHTFVRPGDDLFGARPGNVDEDKIYCLPLAAGAAVQVGGADVATVVAARLVRFGAIVRAHAWDATARVRNAAGGASIGAANDWFHTAYPAALHGVNIAAQANSFGLVPAGAGGTPAAGLAHQMWANVLRAWGRARLHAILAAQEAFSVSSAQKKGAAACFLGAGHTNSAKNNLADYSIVWKASKGAGAVGIAYGGEDVRLESPKGFSITPLVVTITAQAVSKDTSFAGTLTVQTTAGKKQAVGVAGTVAANAGIEEGSKVNGQALPVGAKIKKAAWDELKDDTGISVAVSSGGVQKAVELADINGKQLKKSDAVLSVGTDTLTESAQKVYAPAQKDAAAQNNIKLLTIPAITSGTFTLKVNNEFLGLEGLTEGQKVYVYGVSNVEDLGKPAPATTAAKAAAADAAIDDTKVVEGTYKDGHITVKIDPAKLDDYEALMFATKKISLAETAKTEEEKKAEEQKAAEVAEEDEEEEEAAEEEALEEELGTQAALPTTPEQQAAGVNSATGQQGVTDTLPLAGLESATLPVGGAQSTSLLALFTMLSLAGAVLALKKGKNR
ncbi:MAG: hypothetical protein LBB04_01445 [Oscillospiraceae bacterium]|jgi:hypothetical protein|nr:hypothetical protein [Oscillospiraceae bacterium]